MDNGTAKGNNRRVQSWTHWKFKTGSNAGWKVPIFLGLGLLHVDCPGTDMNHNNGVNP